MIHFKTDGWHVAIRKKPISTILDDISDEFIVLDNGLNYWVADPFVFEYDGSTYIFAEYFDFFTSKGCIAYCTINGLKRSNWRVIIRERYHMSFPFIYESDGCVYLLPETSCGNCLTRYRAISFPDIWEKEVLLDNIRIADSAYFDDLTKLYTVELCEDGSRVGRIFKNVEQIEINNTVFSEDQETCRLGGAFFEYNGLTIKVAQDCSESYGKQLVFLKFNCQGDRYEEEPIKTIQAGEVLLSKPIKRDGIHTYNGSKSYEVIDIKTDRVNLVEVFWRIVNHIRRNLNGGS